MSNQSDKNDVVKEIASYIEKGTLVPFLGAGASRLSPSSLPTSSELKEGFLKAVCLEGSFLVEQFRILFSHDSEDWFRSLRLEVFVEELERELGPRALRILDVYENSEPNLYHKFLAMLAQQPHGLKAIITTNFDMLVEDALCRQKVAYQTRVTKDDFQKFKKVTQSHDAKVTQILKLHGSIDDQQSLMISVRQVGNQRAFTGAKKEVFQDCLKSYDLLFLGYSGGDDFDILPILKSIPSQKKIFWIKHEADEHEIRAIPFANLKRHEIPHEIYSILVNRKSDKGIVIFCNAAKLIEALWEKLELPEENLNNGLEIARGAQTEGKQDNVDKVSVMLRSQLSGIGISSLEKKYLILIRLIARTGHYDKAIEFYRKLLEIQSEAPLAMELKCGLARAYKNNGQRDKAIEVFGEVKGWAKKNQRVRLASQALRGLGFSYRDKYIYEGSNHLYLKKAEEYLRKAVDLLKESKYEFETAWAYRDLGWPIKDLGKVKEAIKAFRKSVRNFEDLIGKCEDEQDGFDLKRQLAWSYRDLAWGYMDKARDSIAKGKANKAARAYQVASGYFDKSIELFKDIGDIENLGVSKRDSAWVPREQGDIHRCIKLDEEAQEWFRLIGDKENCKLTLQELSSHLRRFADLYEQQISPVYSEVAFKDIQIVEGG